MPIETKEDRLQKLIQLLDAATDLGTLRWEETADEDCFRATISTGLIRIGRAVPGNYSIELIDAVGRVIDSFYVFEAGTPGLPELYSKARRQALPQEDAWQKMVEELRSLAGSR